ncbi:hypothetical protein H4Q26_009100 [Puccinia striiformis f. sp. tritici PST-130]|nr:hypothetical protein H4Q26_009100 [Puccinia striiformis f. sp. tritici PST-130]
MVNSQANDKMDEEDYHHHLSQTNQTDTILIENENDPDSTGEFLQRVGKFPLFSGVVRAYERGKGTSKVVRYGADLVESSVTSISGRVASKVGHQRIAQIDRYAGAALDRLGQFSQNQSPSTSPTSPSYLDQHHQFLHNSLGDRSSRAEVDHQSVEHHSLPIHDHHHLHHHVYPQLENM